MEFRSCGRTPRWCLRYISRPPFLLILCLQPNHVFRNCQICSLGRQGGQQSILGILLLFPPFTYYELRWLKLQMQRGSATGLFHDKNKPWRQSQRERLHWFGTNMTGTVPLLLPDGSIKDWDRADLVDKWLDIGLSGGPTQVSRGWDKMAVCGFPFLFFLLTRRSVQVWCRGRKLCCDGRGNRFQKPGH